MNDFFEITATTGLSVTPAGCDLDARTKLNQLAGEINALAKDAEDSLTRRSTKLPNAARSFSRPRTLYAVVNGEALAVNHPLSGEAYKLVQAYA